MAMFCVGTHDGPAAQLYHTLSIPFLRFQLVTNFFFFFALKTMYKLQIYIYIDLHNTA